MRGVDGTVRPILVCLLPGKSICPGSQYDEASEAATYFVHANEVGDWMGTLMQLRRTGPCWPPSPAL